MDSTLELLNYSPKINSAQNDGIDDSLLQYSGKAVQEESGFQEEMSHHWPLYPEPHDPFDAWFVSESDMLILYELLGEFYDEVFEKLSYEDKKTLKDKVKVSVPKTPEELLQMYPEDASLPFSNNASLLAEKLKTDEELLKLYPDNSLDGSSTIHQDSTMQEEENNSVRHKDFSEWFEPIEELILFDILGIDYKEMFEAMTLEEKKELRRKVDSTEPKSREEILAMLDEKEETISELPAKKEKSRRLTLIAQSPKRLTPSYRRPTSSSIRKEFRCSDDKLTCPRLHEAAHPFSPVQRYPHISTGIDLSKVVSPVAQYIHSSPAPPLIRNIRSRTPSKGFLSEGRSKENLPPAHNGGPYLQLPQANYRSSPLLTEQEMESPVKKNVLSPAAVEPKIFRHLGRLKVPKSLQLNEGCQEDIEKLLISSPSPCKMTLKRNKSRKSVSNDDDNSSMVDMSVHEVKAIRKLNEH